MVRWAYPTSYLGQYILKAVWPCSHWQRNLLTSRTENWFSQPFWPGQYYSSPQLIISTSVWYEIKHAPSFLSSLSWHRPHYGAWFDRWVHCSTPYQHTSTCICIQTHRHTSWLVHFINKHTQTRTRSHIHIGNLKMWLTIRILLWKNHVIHFC
jgi:hypothetical protein